VANIVKSLSGKTESPPSGGKKSFGKKEAKIEEEEDQESIEFMTLFRNSLKEKESSESDLHDYDYGNFYSDRSKKKDLKTSSNTRGEFSGTKGN
jgi:hypothetical protein